MTTTDSKARSTTPRERIRAAAEALGASLDAIHGLNPGELRSLIAECGRLDRANCWYLEYRVAPLVRQEAEEALSMLQNQPTARAGRE